VWSFSNVARRKPLYLYMRPNHVHELTNVGQEIRSRELVVTFIDGNYSDCKHKLVHLGQHSVLSKLGNLFTNIRGLPYRSKPRHNQCSQIYDFHWLHHLLQMLSRFVSCLYRNTLPLLPLSSPNPTTMGWCRARFA
jgi:hypothetical protein